MLPTLGQIGPITLRTYTVLIDLGIAVGLAVLYWRAPQGKRTRWLDAGLAATLGALVGARLLYVVVNGDYYFLHPVEALQIWEGGLAWPGALAGGLLAAQVYCQRHGEALRPVLDTLALPIVLLSGLSWGGCLAAGCAYGFEVTPGRWPGWLTANLPDLYGLVLPRFPTQALGLLWSALALLAVWGAQRAAAARRSPSWPAGALGLYAVSLVALGAFALGFTRGDPIPKLLGYRLDVVGSALVLVAATLTWAQRVRRLPPAAPAAPPPPSPVADP